MTKVKFPESGLESLISSSISGTVSNLSSARHQCVYTIPSDFKYLNYLMNLGSEIASLEVKAKKIQALSKSIDQTYNNMQEAMSSYCNEIEDKTLEKIQRIVK